MMIIYAKKGRLIEKMEQIKNYFQIDLKYIRLKYNEKNSMCFFQILGTEKVMEGYNL